MVCVDEEESTVDWAKGRNACVQEKGQEEIFRFYNCVSILELGLSPLAVIRLCLFLTPCPVIILLVSLPQLSV